MGVDIIKDLKELIDYGLSATIALFLLYFLVKEIRTSLAELSKAENTTQALIAKLVDEVEELVKVIDQLKGLINFYFSVGGKK